MIELTNLTRGCVAEYLQMCRRQANHHSANVPSESEVRAKYREIVCYTGTPPILKRQGNQLVVVLEFEHERFTFRHVPLPHHAPMWMRVEMTREQKTP